MILHFLGQYFIRGIYLRFQLSRIAKAITRLQDTKPGEIKEALSKVLRGQRLEFAWHEFEETLHEQYEWVNGERRPVAIRATLPAESFINAYTIVDPQIGSEYFKHLPGILTGFGIIGTFYGLIEGLSHFDPSTTDTALLRQGVTGLFVHVQDAFTFSASAITCAIAVTVIEKWLYASCVKWVGRLAQSLDRLFRAGVGEEYLSSLVQASQDSATQVRQLKEAMVADLKDLLTNLTDRQIAATQQLSNDLSAKIHESLKEPLADIARTVRESVSREHESVGGVLEQLMTSFLAQMRETMGGQIGDLSGLMQRTAESISAVEAAMKGLVTDLKRAGEDSTTNLQTAVRELMVQLTQHRQTEGDAVSAATAGVLSQLQEALGRIAKAHEESAQRTKESNAAAAAGMSTQLALIADGNAATMAATRETLDRFGSVSGEMIDKLASAAGSVTSAVRSVHQASEGLANLATQITSLQGQTHQAASSLGQASTQLLGASERVASTVSQLGAAASRFEAVSKLTAAEADARSHLLKDLQEVIAKSQAASGEFARLSQQVRDALQEGIEQFGTGVSSVLSDHLNQYQKELGTAVGMLTGALSELAEYAGSERN